ncbi:MAG: hypothetical protein LLG37_01810 [Spirochaetia bacterium]|nr:hypothetical protein [Spirochaetia bacterium]
MRQPCVIKEFAGLKPESKSMVLSEAAGYIKKEDKSREALLAALKDMTTNGSVIYPLLLAASANTDAAVNKQIIKFIESSSPAPKSDLAKIKTLLAVICGADEALSELAKKAVESSGDSTLVEQYDNVAAAVKSAIKGLFKLAGSGLQVIFKSQEKSAFEYVIQFYDTAGRSDASNELKAEIEKRGL